LRLRRRRPKRLYPLQVIRRLRGPIVRSSPLPHRARRLRAVLPRTNSARPRARRVRRRQQVACRHPYGGRVCPRRPWRPRQAPTHQPCWRRRLRRQPPWSQATAPL